MFANMQVMKDILLFFTFMISHLIGKTISEKYKLRLFELEEMKNALNIMKAKMKFTYTPIGEIFEEISASTMNPNIASIFQKAKQALEIRLCQQCLEIRIRIYTYKSKTRRY